MLVRVSRKQIVDGLGDYILSEVVPKMGRDKGMQIALTVAVKTVQSNNALVDKVFDSPLVRAVLPPDEAGRYEIEPLLDEIQAATNQNGSLPLTVPNIPLIVPEGGTITLYGEDIAAIRDKIGGTGDA